MEFEVHENIEATSKANESTYSDESVGELSGDGSDSNYLASNREDEDRNFKMKNEVWESCEESEGKLADFEDRAYYHMMESLGVSKQYFYGRKQSGGYLDGGAPDGALGLGLGSISVPSLLAKAGLVPNSFSIYLNENESGRLFPVNGNLYVVLYVLAILLAWKAFVLDLLSKSILPSELIQSLLYIIEVIDI
ncbi:hypothetical protein RIF29_28754 [Crotalaria pallida]|uniref:Uncharacterized protein n=1 Tax=Crotalaria pallida TaxID=3830 RepID=A0AAN9EFM5_CROPI